MVQKISNNQEDSFADFLASIGLNESRGQKNVLRTRDTQGPTYLSIDPDYPSAFAPQMVTIKTLDDAKRLAGIKDRLFDAMAKEPQHDIPDPWNAKKNRYEKHQLSESEERDIHKAFKAYMYGRSDRVKSYSQIINKQYFPLKVAVFRGNDIIVDKDHPLIITGPTDAGVQPLVVAYDSITIKPGGHIISRGYVTIKAQKLISEGGLKGISGSNDESSYVSQGKDEDHKYPKMPKRVTPAKADKGPDAIDGKKGKCTRPAGDGSPGAPGAPGNPGISGNRGNDANPVNVAPDDIKGVIYVGSIGGCGGDGQDGQDGQDGGDGGDPGNTSDNCTTQANRGKGGHGGDGGNGGNGGNGGDGHDVYFSYINKAENTDIKIMKNSASGGHGGSGGSAGAAGAGSGGEVGKPGSAGNPGAPGATGEVHIFQR